MAIRPTEHILLLEDDGSSRAEDVRALESLGYQVSVAATLDEALRPERRADIIVIGVSSGSGRRQAEMGTALFGHLNTPIVLLVGEDAAEELDEFDLTLFFDAVPRSANPLFLQRALQLATKRASYRRDLMQKEVQQEALAAAQVGVWEWFVASGECNFSNVWAEMLGYSSTELDGKLSTWVALVHPDDLAASSATMDAHLRGEVGYYQNEHRLRCKDGTYRWILDRGKIVERGAAGQPLRVAGTHVDISERKQAERQLERWQKIFEYADWGIAISDQAGRNFALVNPAFARMHGYAPDELIGSPILELVSPDWRQATTEQISVANKKSGYRFEPVHLRKDGSPFNAQINVTVVRDEMGAFQYRIVNIQDITEQQAVAEHLRQSEEKYRTLFETLSEGVALNQVIYDENQEMVDYRVVEVNPNFYSIADYAGPVVGSLATQLYGLPSEYIRTFWHKHKTFTAAQYTEIVSPISGHVFIVSTSPIKNDHFVTSFVDITERKRVEEALRRSETHYRMLIENTLLGYSYCQMLFEDGVPQDFIYLDVNPAFERLSGLKDVIGKKRSEVIPDIHKSTPEAFDVYLRVASSGKPEALEYYVKVLKTWIAATIYCPEPGYFITLFDVITEKKLAEIALRESEQKFHMLFEKSMDGILLTHPDGRVFAANPAACRILEKTEDEIVRDGRPGLVNTADPRLLPALQERNRSGSFEGVLTFLRGDGTVFPVELTSVMDPSKSNGAHTHIIFRDISERARAEAALKKISDELRSVMESTTDVIAMMDTEYRYTLFNSAFQKEFKTIFGQDVQAGDSMLALLAHVPNDLADALIYWKRALRGESFIVSQQFGDAGLARNWYELHFSPIADADGKVVGAVHIVHNISERMRIQEALRASEERYRLLFENMQEGFALQEVITDEQGNTIDFRTLDANRAYEKHTGTRREDVIGRTLLETQPNADRRMIERYGRVALTGEPLIFEYYSRTFNRHLRVRSFSPKRGQFATVFEDVSEVRKAENAQRESEQKYRALFDNKVFAILIFDQQTLRILDANEALIDLYGYEREELFTELTVLDLSAQEDLTMKAIQQTAQTGSSFVPMRYHRRKNNRLFPVEAAIGTFVWQGHPTGFLIIQEISERVSAELKLKESENRFRQVADTAPVLIWMSGTDAACNFFNAQWMAYTGRTLEQELGNGWAEGIHPDDFQHCMETYLDAFIERREFEMEYRLRRANGEYGILWAHGVPRFTSTGEFLGYIGSCLDITERVTAEEKLRASEAALQNSNQKLIQQLGTIGQLQEELRHQAVHDALTGLYNRHYLTEALEAVIIRAEREKSPLSIVMADVDHFKVLNDTYGHPVGDLFLIEVANLLKKQVRGSDFVCRFGGEEFLLVLPGATMQFAMRRAEEIRQKCAEIVIDHAGQPITAKLSLGVATFPDQGQQGSDVIVKADQALYESKQTGRDRVTGWIDGQLAVYHEEEGD